MIELHSVFAGYGKETVLNDLSAAIPGGALTGIIGTNGSGKSTLLKTMLGMLPHRGCISIDGACLPDLSRQEIAKKAAYLAQGKATPDMTVEQLVLHGRFPHLHYPRQYSGKDRQIAISAMAQMGIGHLAQKPLHTLSGGMRQKAYIAMALAQGTDYILLDEPTTYLDISHQLGLMQTLRQLADGGKGIAAVMHDLPLAFTYCDHILLLADGRVLCSGTPQELCCNPLIKKVFGVEIAPAADAPRYHYRY